MKENRQERGKKKKEKENEKRKKKVRVHGHLANSEKMSTDLTRNFSSLKSINDQNSKDGLKVKAPRRRE